jgi:hypothetical protein
VGKRSSFERRPRDAYDTPAEAVRPLLAHLSPGTRFVEPCAGNGVLVDHLTAAGHSCLMASDIEPRRDDIVAQDALTLDLTGLQSTDRIITNSPWARPLLHPLIERFSDYAPTWLLFDADWVHTRQAIPYLPRLRRIVSVGRVKWIADSPFTGKDNCAWHLFTTPTHLAPEFYARAA